LQELYNRLKRIKCKSVIAVVGHVGHKDVYLEKTAQLAWDVR